MAAKLDFWKWVIAEIETDKLQNLCIKFDAFFVKWAILLNFCTNQVMICTQF